MPQNENNYFEWEACIKSPVKSEFSGAEYALNVKFPNDYPFNPPKVSFTSEIKHDKIDKDGNIDINIL